MSMNTIQHTAGRMSSVCSLVGMQKQRWWWGGSALHLSEEHLNQSLYCCSSLTSDCHHLPLWPWSSGYSGTCRKKTTLSLSMKMGHLYFFSLWSITGFVKGISTFHKDTFHCFLDLFSANSFSWSYFLIWTSLPKMCFTHQVGWFEFPFQSPDVSLTPLLYAAENTVLTETMHPHPHNPSSLTAFCFSTFQFIVIVWLT